MPAICEIEQAWLDFWRVEIGPLFTPPRAWDAHAGRLVQFVKMSQPAFIQEVVDNEATLAAKHLLRLGEANVCARLAAMETGRAFARRASAPRRRLHINQF